MKALFQIVAARLANLFSRAFLLTALGAGYEFANGHPVLGLVAIIFYVLMNQGPQAVAQVIAVLKGVDRIVEALGMTKADAVLDEITAGLEGKLAVAGLGGVNQATGSAPTPVLDALGK